MSETGTSEVVPMFLSELQIDIIKCFDNTSFTLPLNDHGGTWCVILGENGTGKSTLLQAIALSLLGKSAWSRFLDHPESWVRQGKRKGRFSAAFSSRVPNGAAPMNVSVEFSAVSLTANDVSGEDDVVAYLTPSFLQQLRHLDPPKPFVVAGYGAFRRMEAIKNKEEPGRTRHSNAFVTLFNDEAGLYALSDWLLRLDYRSKDEEATKSPRERERLKKRLQAIIEVVNSLLPAEGPFRLRGVSANGLYFASDDGEPISLENMSDGYRTMFALAVDLLRQIWLQNPLTPSDTVFVHDQDGRVSVNMEGIVLIDEVDVHLHPKWQQEIGSYLQRTLPHVQFIVASHSPFVAQSATEGGLFALQRLSGSTQVSVEPLQPVQGLAAEEILLSPAFGLHTTRDPETESLLEEHRR